jgi:protein-tyrosine phosphatase
MAEALFKKMELPDIEVRSAGIYAADGSDASTNAKKVLDEQNIAHNHRSSALTESLMEWSDYILTMTEGHKGTIINLYPNAQSKTFTLKEFAKITGYPDIADPFGGSVEMYRATFFEIKEALEKVANRLNGKDHT